MQVVNPEFGFERLKHHSIEQYINENLQMKTLKMKKFQFQDSFSFEINTSRKLKNSLTAREHLDFSDQRNQSKMIGWQPKLSHRRLMKQPKLLLSVERRKIKTSQSMRKANQVFKSPKSRIGFRGQKVRSNSFLASKPEEKTPPKLIVDAKHHSSQKKYKPIPNFHFNFRYIIQQRKKGKEQQTIEQQTKKGSNNGYFAFFGSNNFTKYLEKKSNYPNTTRLTQGKNKKTQTSNIKTVKFASY